jgi:hypothetical protein
VQAPLLGVVLNRVDLESPEYSYYSAYYYNYEPDKGHRESDEPARTARLPDPPLAVFALRWLLIPVAGAAALWIAWTEYQTLRGLEWSRLESSLSSSRTRQPWGGLSGRALAAAPDATLGVEPEAAEAVLAWQLRRYPLDPLRWFNRALNAHLAGECPARVQDHL